MKQKFVLGSIVGVCLLASGCVSEEERYHHNSEVQVDGDMGEEVSEVDVVEAGVVYSGGESEDASLDKNLAAISNECVVITQCVKRYTKVGLMIVVPYEGIVKDFSLTVEYDTGEQSTVEVTRVLGGVPNEVFIPMIDNSASSVKIVSCSYAGTDEVVSDRQSFGKEVALVSANTLEAKQDVRLFVFNGDGCVINFVDVKKGAFEVINFGAEWYQEVQ